MMNIHKYIIPLCGFFAALSSQAEWTVVSTFDDNSALDLITDSINVEGSNARSEIVGGKWAVYPGDLFDNTSNLYAMLDLGTDLKAASIANDQPVTVYLEIIQPMVPDGQGGTRKAIVDTVWGVSNFPPSQVLETRYNSYNVMQRINGGNDSFEGRNGGSYEVVDLFSADVTYKIWFVIDYNLNFYETYIEGGQWTTQTRLDTAVTQGYWEFRVNPGPADLAQYFLVALSRGNAVDGEKGIDPTYFDNVAIDTTGANLSTPPVGGDCDPGPGVFANYCVEGGWINTGDHMGMVYVEHYPWVYIQTISDYVYVGGGAENGIWLHLYR